MNIRVVFCLSLFIGFNSIAIPGQQAGEARRVVRLKATVDIRRSLDFDSFSLQSFFSSASSLFNPIHNLMLVPGKNSWQFIDATSGDIQWTLYGFDGLPILSSTTQRLLILNRKKSAQVRNAKTGE